MSRPKLLPTLLTLLALASIAPVCLAQNPATDGEFETLTTEDNGWYPNLFAIQSSYLYPGVAVTWGYRYQSPQGQIWNPTNNSFTLSTPTSMNANWDLFCTGMAQLGDGRLFVAGGHIMNDFGQRYTGIVDQQTGAWSIGPSMAAPRWYPTCVTATDGRVLIMSGTQSYTVNENNSKTYLWNDTPEIYDPRTGDITAFNENFSTHYYPYLFATPNERVFYAGGRVRASNDKDTYMFDLNTGTYQYLASSNFRGGSAVMYAPGTILKSGLGQHSSALQATTDSEVIDLTASTPEWVKTAPMNIPRREHNLVVLPDGKVLAFGGSQTFDSPTSPNSQMQPEEFDPITRTWSLLNVQSARIRAYHSTAYLVRDGRVFLGGGNFSPSYQWYKPAYLFKGPRPTLSIKQGTVLNWEKPFMVQVSNQQTVTQFVLMGLSTVTHSFDSGQKRIPLAKISMGTKHIVFAPKAHDWCAPGYYMLFALNSLGVPSEGYMVKLGVK